MIRPGTHWTDLPKYTVVSCHRLCDPDQFGWYFIRMHTENEELCWFPINDALRLHPDCLGRSLTDQGLSQFHDQIAVVAGPLDVPYGILIQHPEVN